MSDKPGVYTEWLVTADQSTALWQREVGPYRFVWSARTIPHLCCDDAAAEAAARDFAAACQRHGTLVGLQLARRTVEVTEWEAVPLVPGVDPTARAHRGDGNGTVQSGSTESVPARDRDGG